MSVEGQDLSFEESISGEHDVDPADVDWSGLFEMYAADDGLLDVSTRTDAVTSMINGIENSRQAESLLAEAAEQGHIEERDSDYYLKTESTVDASDIDWTNVFESVAGGIDEPLPNYAGRGILISSELGLESEERAHALVEDARDRGIIVSVGSGGLYLADAVEDGLVDEESETDTEPETPTANVETESETRPELEALREQSDDVEEYADSLEGLLTDVLDRLDAVEERQDRQDERVNEYLREKNEEQRIGLSELQIRRLREGDMLSTDGVDMDVLRDEFGDDLVEVSNGKAVRLAEPKVDEDSSRSTELPNFDNYCELEENRLKLHLQLETPESIKADGIYDYRCLTIWSNAEMLATTNGAYPGKMVIPKQKVEAWVWKHGRNGADRKSMDTICNRVMDEMADKTDGVIEKDVRKGNSVLIFEKDALEDARCPRFQSRSVDGDEGGDLITPLL